MVSRDWLIIAFITTAAMGAMVLIGLLLEAA
jgi:hypothetical protein